MVFSSLSPPPTHFTTEELLMLGEAAAEELMAIALGEDPRWILSNQGDGCFVGKIRIEEVDSEETNGSEERSQEKERKVSRFESEWVKDWSGWKCVRERTGDNSSAKGLIRTREVASIVGVCKEHERKVEVLIAAMDD